MEDIILYHGSRSGIDGDIKPISRSRCDFGRGFYMGTDKMQAKSLVATFYEPKIYTLRLKLSEIPESQILYLDDEKKWLHTVLACRGAVSTKQMPSLKKALSALNNCDIVVGKIADDSMKEALSAFCRNVLTDKGLIDCLQKVNYGYQYVAKTDFACSKIEILDEKRIFGRDKQVAIEFGNSKRNMFLDVVEKAKEEYSNKGDYLHNILIKEKAREVYK